MMPPNQKTTDSEICTLIVMFPVESDEQAIDVKKKISDIVSGIKDSRIEFRLSAVPVKQP